MGEFFAHGHPPLRGCVWRQVFHILFHFLHLLWDIQSTAYTLPPCLLKVRSADFDMAASHANKTMAECATTNITSLPLELLWEITSYLPVSGQIALKLSNKTLLLTVPTPPPDWDQDASRCEKKAHRRYVNEGRETAAGRRRCINCDLVTYAGRFPTSAPLCKWHEPRFMSNSVPGNLDPEIKASLDKFAGENKSPSWIAFERMYCIHNREVIGWHEADCKCNCDSCGHFPVPCFVRLPSKRDTRHWRSSKLTEDGLAVDEEHWVDSRFDSGKRLAAIANDNTGPGKSLGAYQQTVPIIQLDLLDARIRQS